MDDEYGDGKHHVIRRSEFMIFFKYNLEMMLLRYAFY